MAAQATSSTQGSTAEVSGAAGRAPSVRTRVVWASLAGAMLSVGGLLSLASPASTTAGEPGWTLPALTAVGPQSIYSILRPRENVPLDRSRWTSIVIHDSGSSADTPESIRDRHTSPPYNLTGLGFHFIIGNGSRMTDGEVYLGYRWMDQLPGAHVAGERGAELNQSSIGICLVGNGDRQPFTPKQLDALAAVVKTLMVELGIPLDAVHLHSEVSGSPSPGRLFPAERFREELRRRM